MVQAAVIRDDIILKYFKVLLSDYSMKISETNLKSTYTSEIVRGKLNELLMSCGYKLYDKTCEILKQLVSIYGESTTISFNRLKQDILNKNIALKGVYSLDCEVGYYAKANLKEVYVVKKLDEEHLSVSKIDRDEYKDLYGPGFDNRYFNTKIYNWINEYYARYGVRRQQKLGMVKRYNLAKILCEKYPNDVALDIRDIMKDANQGKIDISDRWVNERILDNVILIERPNYYREFATFYIHLRLGMSIDEVTRWYKTEKFELYRILQENYDSEKRPERNLKYYQLNSARLGKGNILSLTFKLKEGLIKIEKEMRAEEKRKLEQKEEFKANKRIYKQR